MLVAHSVLGRAIAKVKKLLSLRVTVDHSSSILYVTLSPVNRETGAGKVREASIRGSSVSLLCLDDWTCRINFSWDSSTSHASYVQP